MTDLSILMYSPDGRVTPAYESIASSIGDYSFKFLTTGPIRPTYKCSDWYESFRRPIASLQKLLYEVKSEFVTIMTDDAIYEPSALSRLLDRGYTSRKEGIQLVRGNDEHVFLPLSRVGYLAEIGGLDCDHPTVVDACNDFTTRVFRDQRDVSISSSRDITFRRDHLKSRNIFIDPKSTVINLDNWKYAA